MTPPSQIVSVPPATWRSYLPDHILRLLATAGDVSNPPVTQGTDAVVLFADVVGFTAMTESFAGSGSYGTEQLTRVINRWFEVTVNVIAGSGGSVVDFAGDALVGMFTYDERSGPAVARRAVRCAELIREATASVAPILTPGGAHSLTIRVGLSRGPLRVMLLGDPAIRLQHLVAGPALSRAVGALHDAAQGEIVVDPELRAAAGSGAAEPVPRPEPTMPDAGLERLLTPFLHPAIRDRLRFGRRELVNEHRKVTTAFVRLPDLSPDDPAAVQALQRYLAAGVAVIDRYGGHLRHLMADDKGTVLVAVFGTPVSHENDEERALRCCRELLALPGGPYRIGVTTGPVYCGEVGSDVRREYAVVGDVVNLAARLMQVAPPGGLLVDEATREPVRDLVLTGEPQSYTAKGKAFPVRAWVVHDIHEAVPLPSPAGPVVGRACEVERLDAAVRRVHRGHGALVWLHGEAGLGKSRLAAETCRMARAAGFTGHGGGCRSHGTSAAYLVWHSIWRELLDLDPARPVAEQQAALTARVARHDGTGERAPLVAAVVNLPMPDTDLTAQLDRGGREQLLRSTLLALLRERAADGPIVLTLEDCHWIDPASLALLDLIARDIADLPVLLLATSREPLPARFAGCEQAVPMALAPMTGAVTDRLTAQRLRERYGPDAVIAPELVRRIGEQAVGNAFHLEELVSYLHGMGVDPADPGALAALHLPGNVQRLVMARIDQLTDDEKAAIKVASVLGRRFPAAWITEVYPAAGSPEQVEGHLGHLRALDLTMRVDDADHEYEFKHPITQEAAYQSITYDTRAVLHERAGLLVERTFAGHLDEYVDVLAHHYQHTGRIDKQRIWFRAAGDRAKAMFANEAATDYYGRLLPLLPEAEHAALHVEIGTVHHHTGRWADADDSYRRAIRSAEETGQLDILAAGQRQLGDLLLYTHSYAEAVTWLDRALTGFERLGDAPGVSRAMERMTFALIRHGAYAQALSLAQRHLAMATGADDLPAMSAAQNHIGLVLLNSGRPEEGLHHLRRALSTAQRAGDRHGVLSAANNLGWASVRAADHVQAIASYRQALAMARDIGARHAGNIIVGNMTEIYREEGDLRRARTCVLHALPVAIELGDATSVADLIAELGETAAAEDRLAEAGSLLSLAIAQARELDLPYYLCEWLYWLARVRVAEGRLAEADRLTTEALHVAEKHGERETQVNAYVLSIRLRREAGQITAVDAAKLLRGVVEEWTEPHERAVLLDAIWQADPRDEHARTTAAAIYRELYARAPRVDYREAHRRLTGESLPPGPPLPELPDWVTAEAGLDVSALLRHLHRDDQA